MSSDNFSCPEEILNIIRESLYRATKRNIALTPFNYHKVFIETALDMGMSEREIRKYIYGNDYESIEEFEELKNAVLSITENVESITEKTVESMEKGDEAYKEIIDTVSSSKQDITKEIIKELEKMLHINETLKNELESARVELKKQRKTIESIKELSNRDQLTGLYTRRYMENVFNDALYNFRRYSRIFSVVMIDLNNFKEINDTYGHPAGDVVLQRISQILLKETRKTDVPVRYGGDEFIIILPDTPVEGAKSFAEKILKKIKSLRFEKNGERFYCTASAGVTQVKDNDVIDSILARVDEALYETKNKGKDGVTVL